MSEELYFGAETENKHFDVGLVGWWFASNYGSAMTYYGLGKILEDMNLSSLMIQIPKLNNTPWEPQVKKTMDFMGRYFSISNYRPVNRLKEYNDLCDTFMLGSDQLWTKSAIDLVGYTFFLDFVEQGKKKIAFATSFGHEKFKGTDEQKANASAILKTFDYISVRERSGIKASQENFGIDVQRDLDPVFICDVKHYDALADKSSLNDEDYLLCYILDPTEEKQAAIKYAAEKLNLKIIALLDMKTEDRRKAEWYTGDLRLNPSIEDFIYYFKHCKFLITDSHHGVCFGIIYNKNFISIANYSRGVTRFTHLLDLFELSEKLIYEPNKIIGNETVFKEINYEKVNEILRSEKKISIERLKEALRAKPKNIPIPVIRNSAQEEIFDSYNNKIKPAAITSMLNIKECAGCGACVSVCPKNALSLQQDKWGYYRSALNTKLCVNCGLCSNVCPALNLPQKTNKKEPPLYAFIAADENILESSSSGGIFPLLANEAFKRGGCVAGAAWTDDLHVEHILIENKEELHKLQKSKYLQSYLGDFDRKIKEKLNTGRFVLFSGCPCQVAGLKSYLGKDYDNLITVDLLCGNSPSSEFFQKYLKDSFPKGVKDYQFRYKKQGWNSDCLTLTLTDGTKIERRGGGQDDYQKLYHPHVMCPPHCEQCKYQALPRFGDITIGDFWGYSKHDSSIDTSKGISAVLCNNEKGRVFFDSIPDEEIKVKKNVPLEWVGGNGYAYTGHNYCSPNRDKFYKVIQTMPFSDAIKIALTPNRLSSYPDPLSLQPLHYDTSQLRFRFDENMWEEHFINGVAILTTKVIDPPLGNYAIIPLMHPLVKGKRYRLSVRFKVKTQSKEFSFHIKESDSKKIQVVYVHTVKPENAVQWMTVKTDFIPGGNMYDEFMIGSAHIRGEERFFAVDYIDISEVETANQELKNQLTWMTNAANFFESLSKDYFSDHKFDSFIKGMSGKKIAVLKTQDRAGQILLKATEAYGVQVVFSSSKAYLKQLTDEEWQMCKTADTIVCCCVHGTVPDEREGTKAISILSLLQ